MVAGFSLADLAVLARSKFLGGTGYPARMRPGAVAAEATNALVHACKVVVITLFEKQRADVRWVSETAQLDQEEALAYLLADLLDYELLPDEARAIGWAARGAAKAFKGKPKRKPGAAKPKPSADQKLKDAFSTKKAKARQAAAKDPALLDDLEERLADLDAVLATHRRELARAVVPLDWPARNTVIATAPAPAPATAASRFAALKRAALRADEAVVPCHRRTSWPPRASSSAHRSQWTAPSPP